MKNEQAVHVTKICGIFVATVKKNLGTERPFQFTASSIDEVLEKAYKATPKEIMPNPFLVLTEAALA